MNVHVGHDLDPGCHEHLLGMCKISELQESEYAIGFEAGSRLAKLDTSVTVDGVAYGVEKIRTLVLERHLLASENNQLRRRLDRADLHLRRRTSALTRLIARKGAEL